VPGATSTLPVEVLKVRPAGTEEPAATESTAFDGEAAAPLIVSEVNALTTAVPPARPLMPEALSLVATIGEASTVTVAVLVAQLVGLSCSQIW
jgi:hypothetical protein